MNGVKKPAARGKRARLTREYRRRQAVREARQQTWLCLHGETWTGPVGLCGLTQCAIDVLGQRTTWYPSEVTCKRCLSREAQAQRFYGLPRAAS